jgi:hypothetical protein
MSGGAIEHDRVDAVAYRCMRCGTEKLETYDVHGDLMNRILQVP